MKKHRLKDLYDMEKDAVAILRRGGVGVMPTDTIYGIVGSAMRKETVRRIYALRGRDPKKPMIVLIGARSELARRFGILVSSAAERVLRKLWPGPVSIILPCLGKKFAYLHRGAGTIAFRLPDDGELRSFLKKTGPLVAPSANAQGEAPARTALEARRRFGDTVDFYRDGGVKKGTPSVLVAMLRS